MSAVKTYRSKTVTVEAIQYLGAENLPEVEKFASTPPDDSTIPTNLKGEEKARWIREHAKYHSSFNPSKGEFLVGGAPVKEGDYVVKMGPESFLPVIASVFESQNEEDTKKADAAKKAVDEDDDEDEDDEKGGRRPKTLRKK